MNISYACPVPTRVIAFHGPLIMHMVTILYELYFLILVYFLHPSHVRDTWVPWVFISLDGHSLAIRVLVVLTTASSKNLLQMPNAHPYAWLPWPLIMHMATVIYGFHFVILVHFLCLLYVGDTCFPRVLTSLDGPLPCGTLWACCPSPHCFGLSAHISLMFLKYDGLRPWIVCPLFCGLLWAYYMPTASVAHIVNCVSTTLSTTYT